MKTLGIPIAALLFGASVALPISANAAAIGGAGLRAAAVDAGVLGDVGAGGRLHTLPGGVVLVQYNEGGGGGGGGGYAPQGGGGYSRPYNGNGGYAPQGGGGYNRRYNGNGGNSFNNIGAGAAIIYSIIRQHQMEQQYKQQQQQQQYNNQLQKRREQTKYREELEHQRKFDIEKARLEEQRQEQLDELKKQLNEERKARLNQPQSNTPQPNPSYSPQPNTPLPNPAYLPQPNGPAPTVENDPYHDGPHHDRVGDIVINIIPAPDNCPDNFQELRVGATVLYPRRTDYPADPSLCAGTTGKGCYLKVEPTPATCGGSRQVCVERCPTPLPPKVVDIRPPYVQPTPPYQPPPVTCNGGNCAPPPVACPGGNCAPPPVACSGGNCAPLPQINRACPGGNCAPLPQINRACPGGNCEPLPQINRACTGGNCGQQFEPSQKPIKQASLTDKSHKYVEPEHRKPIKQASLTDESHEYVEPEHRKPIKQASLTDESHNYIQPKPAKKIKQALRTDTANKYVQPKPATKIKQALRTDTANKYVQPKPAKKIKQALRTDTANKYVQQKPTKQAQRTDKANKYIQPNGKLTKQAKRKLQKVVDLIHLAKQDDDEKKEADEKKKQDEAKERQEQAEAKSQQEGAKERQEQAYEDQLDQHPDSKGCSKHGGVPKAWLRNSKTYEGLMQCLTNGCKPSTGDIPNASFIAPNTALRDALTETLSNVPEVGGLLSGVAQELWGDPTTPALFDQMQDYVKGVVPEMIEDAETQDLKKRLIILRDKLADYATTQNLLDRGEKLTNLIGDLANLQREFVDPAHPEKRLAYFVGFATLRLAALREKYLHTKDYWGNNLDLDKNSHALNAAIDEFQKQAQEIKDSALAERLSHIYVDRHVARQGGGWGPNYKVWAATAKDDRCDWPAHTYEHDEFAHCFSDMINSHCDPTDQTINADKQAARRKEIVAKAYGEDLDLILAPITHWAHATDMAHKVVAQAAPAGGGANQR